MIILSVDFDGTLSLSNNKDINFSEPNKLLIKRLQELKKNINVYIKIVTARGAKNNLSEKDKIIKYRPLIEKFCYIHNIPYDEISFNKEYADLYIDDMTISPYDEFLGFISSFTKNNIIFTDNSVIKICNTSILENAWYNIANKHFKTPKVLFCNSSTLITEKIPRLSRITIEQCIDLLHRFRNLKIKNFEYKTYIDNIFVPETASIKTKFIIDELKTKQLTPTFFHGDFTRNNIIVNNDIYLIDPNYKNIFGNYITDASKLYFSIIAYEKNLAEAHLLTDEFGEIIIKYAVAEGLRVCRYVPNYISIVNNIAEVL
jgi:hypothetical protein